MLPKLRSDTPQRILDIGCGIGRWAEALSDRAAAYVGIDISPRLIEIARERIRSANTVFLVGSAADTTRSDILEHGPFDLVIMSGIMIYLNDHSLLECLRGLAAIVAPRGRVYMREPLALGDRLTLSDHWSAELNQHYSAIYRSAVELETFFADTLYEAGFEPARFAPLYSEARHNNRQETVQHIALVKRV